MSEFQGTSRCSGCGVLNSKHAFRFVEFQGRDLTMEDCTETQRGPDIAFALVFGGGALFTYVLTQMRAGFDRMEALPLSLVLLGVAVFLCGVLPLVHFHHARL